MQEGSVKETKSGIHDKPKQVSVKETKSGVHDTPKQVRLFIYLYIISRLK